MNNVVAVNFKENGKLYFFKGNNLIKIGRASCRDRV